MLISRSAAHFKLQASGNLGVDFERATSSSVISSLIPSKSGDERIPLSSIR
jgi:hypothetical protein